MKAIVNKYRRWEANQGKFVNFLMDNYLKYDNHTIAYMMGRTVDSVRKQLKKMKLKRPRKTKVRTGEPSKRGRKKRQRSIFDMRITGMQDREKKKREIAKNKKIREQKKIEKQKVDELYSDPVIPSAPSTSDKEYIVRIINGRETIIFGQPDKIRDYAERCMNKETFVPGKKGSHGKKDNS